MITIKDLQKMCQFNDNLNLSLWRANLKMSTYFKFRDLNDSIASEILTQLIKLV